MITLHVDLESQANGKQNLRSLTFKKKICKAYYFSLARDLEPR